MQRREFLQLSIPALLTVPTGLSGLVGCTSEQALDVGLFLGGFASSLETEHDYVASVVGELPADLAGSVLYRNGPGLFERDGVRKRTLLDGDGMVNAYFFEPDGTVRFRNRFVHTPKYLAEQREGRYLYDTWTTLAPRPLGPPESDSSQAGVSVWRIHDKLLAFDESNFPQSLDPNTLETLGVDTLGFSPDATLFAAHPKLIAATGEVAMFGLDYRTQTLDLTVFAADGTIVEHRKHPLVPVRYLHDFFATPTHLVVALHPAVIDFERVAAGNALRDAMRWTAGLGNRWLIFERGSDAPPIEIEGPARWMWHSANMFVREGKLVCDWIGYDDAEHFLGPDADFEQVMLEQLVTTGARGRLRRTILDPVAGSYSEEQLSAAGNFEFPQVPYPQWGQEHRKIYSCVHPGDGSLWTAILSFDTENGREDMYDFGEEYVVGEPILAEGSGGRRWLLSEVADRITSRSFLAVFDAEAISAGPVAQVELNHHLPIRFHGHWVRS